jgi:hypothetical protein
VVYSCRVGRRGSFGRVQLPENIRIKLKALMFSVIISEKLICKDEIVPF